MNKVEDFSIGTKVKIDKNSKYYNEASPKDSFNPSGIHGVVYKIWDYGEDDNLSIGVGWSNGKCNGYSPEDLKILGQVAMVDEHE